MLSWQFFTILPSVKVEAPSEADMTRSALFLPLVGFVLGILLFLMREVFAYFLPIQAADCLALVVYTWCTGALHVDGLMDTFDAIGSRQAKERALAIMKDSRVGAIGAIAAIFLLMGKWIAWTSFPTHMAYPFIVVPVLSRLAMLWSMANTQSAKPEGLSRLFAGKVSPVYAVVISTVVFCVSVLFVPIITVVIVLAIFYLMVFTIPAYFTNRFGGMTGDTFGALAEMVEFVLFFVLLATLKHAFTG